MIYAGNLEQLEPESGLWVFVDVGYSCGAKSCGLLIGRGEATAHTFGQLKAKLIELALNEREPLNLVLEAPLSCAYNSAGNPTGRAIEKKGSATRYWYVGAGAAVLLSSLDLVNAMRSCALGRDIRLFEGFASFKSDATSHTKDVEDLREIFWDKSSDRGKVFGPDQLLQKQSDRIQSAFILIGKDYGIPPVGFVGS